MALHPLTVVEQGLLQALATGSADDVVTQLMLGADPNLNIPCNLATWGAGNTVFGAILSNMRHTHGTHYDMMKQKMKVLVCSGLHNTVFAALRPTKKMEDLWALLRVGWCYQPGLGLEIINVDAETVPSLGPFAEVQANLSARRFLVSLKIASAAAVPYEVAQRVVNDKGVPDCIKFMVCFKNRYRWPPEWDVGLNFDFQ